jgi:hypothetical protein
MCLSEHAIFVRREVVHSIRSWSFPFYHAYRVVGVCFRARRDDR